MSQTRLGELIGFAQSEVSALEGGPRPKPLPVALVRQLAKVLDVDVDDVLAAAEQRDPDAVPTIADTAA